LMLKIGPSLDGGFTLGMSENISSALFQINHAEPLRLNLECNR